jgi:hypothetical protein
MPASFYLQINASQWDFGLVNDLQEQVQSLTSQTMESYMIECPSQLFNIDGRPTACT